MVGATGTSSRPSMDLQDCQDVLLEMSSDRPQLQRILVARHHDLEQATSLFWEQVRFRARWKPKQIQPSDIPNALPSGAWRLCGYAKNGCIVSNYKLQHWDPDAYGAKQPGETQEKAFEKGVDEYVRYVVFMLELMIQQMRPMAPQKFVLIFDLKGFYPSLVFRKNVRAMIIKLIYVAQSQYPERLQKVILVNAPMGFESAWRLIKPLLDGKTATKIGFCAKLPDLLQDVDESVLAREYGGTHDEYPLPDGSTM